MEKPCRPSSDRGMARPKNDRHCRPIPHNPRSYAASCSQHVLVQSERPARACRSSRHRQRVAKKVVVSHRCEGQLWADNASRSCEMHIAVALVNDCVEPNTPLTHYLSCSCHVLRLTVTESERYYLGLRLTVAVQPTKRGSRRRKLYFSSRFAFCQRAFCAREIAVLPISVFGPVERPPWNLQRCFPGTTLLLQRPPTLVRAPHDGRSRKGR